MEGIWTYPLFIVCPLIGLIVTVIGIIKVRNGESKSTLFTGVSFLALPLIYLSFMFISHLRLENRLEGKYNIGNDRETLLLKKDGTFELKSSINFLNSGNGTWETEEIDSPILKLNFEQKNTVWLEINESENTIRLSSMSGESNITNDFIQQAYSR